MHKKKVLDSLRSDSLGFEFRFSMDLHDLRHSEHDLPFLENVCLSVRLQNFVDTVSQEQIGGN